MSTLLAMLIETDVLIILLKLLTSVGDRFVGIVLHRSHCANIGRSGNATIALFELRINVTVIGLRPNSNKSSPKAFEKRCRYPHVGECTLPLCMLALQCTMRNVMEALRKISILPITN